MMDIYWTNVCGNNSQYDAFWSTNLSLNTDTPDLTRCFQDTVLVWGPLCALVITLVFYVPYLRRHRSDNTWRNKGTLQWTKLAISVGLVCVSFSTYVLTLLEYHVLYRTTSVLLQLVMMIAVLILTHVEFKKGFHTSVVLSIFLSVFMMTSMAKARSVWLEQRQTTVPQKTDLFLYWTSATLTAVLWLLNLPSDTRAAFQSGPVFEGTEHEPLLARKRKNHRKNWSHVIRSPEIKASFYNRVIFGWYTKFLYTSNRTFLSFDDLYDLLDKVKCSALMPKFLPVWEKKFRQQVFSKESAERRFPSSDDSRAFDHVEELASTKNDSPKAPSLLLVLLQTIGRDFWLSNIYRFFTLFVMFLNPMLLSVLLDFLQTRDPYLWKGIAIALSLGVVDFVYAVVVNHSLHYGYIFGLQTRGVLTAAVYRKVLKLSSASKKATTTGQIVNLISVDCQRIQDSFVFMPNLWIIPPMTVIAVALMWNNIGASSLVGLGLLILLIIPVNGLFVSNWIKQLQVTQMIYKDSRVKQLGEILSGIKVLKLYAWERAFLKKVNDTREDELRYMKKANYLSAVSAITWNCTTYLVTFVIFAVYITTNDDAVLDAKKVFVTSALVNVLNVALSFMPMAVSYAGQAWVALARIRDFLILEEIPTSILKQEPVLGAAISLKTGTFSWNRGANPTLSNIDMLVRPGELVAVVGRVGSGKSSLISAILGEMWHWSGSVATKGSICYVPQQAWIQNKSLRNNILFGKPDLAVKYADVIDACAMTADLEILIDGDQTEIGEKGINLSGGQKQRVSLARAVYQDADVYLLDDPLSAVDAHVGKHLFEKVIGSEGILKHKTRLLVTHSLSVLPHVDRVVMMEAGAVVDMGTYTELIERDSGAFSEFLRNVSEHGNGNGVDMEIGTASDDMSVSQASVQYHRRRSSQQVLPRRRQRRRHSEHSNALSDGTFSGTSHASGPKTQVLVEEETAQEGDLKLSVVKGYVVAGGMVAFSMAVVFHLLYGVSLVMGSIWLGLWTDDVTTFSGNVTRDQNVYRLTVYGGIICGQVLTTLMGSIGIAIGSVMASRALHERVTERIMRAPMRFFDTTPLGRIMNRLSRDMDMVDFNVPLQCRQWFFQAVPLVAMVVILCYASPIFLVAVVPIAIIFGLIMKVFVKTVRQLRRIDSVRRSPLLAHLDESVVGASSIRAYGREAEFIQRCDDLTDDSQRAWYLFVAGQRWLGVFLQFLGTVVVCLTAVLTVIQRDSSSAGLAGMSVNFSLTAYIYLNFYVRAVADLETYMVSVERIEEYTEVESEAAWDDEASRPDSSWPAQGQIQFKDYSTRYRPGLDLVLKNINCDISQGEKVGVVGRTGAGKSTIALGLFRLLEADSGVIKVDGLDISQLGLYDLRARLTIIPQDPVIFSGSLRHNLDPLGTHTDPELWTALNLAHLGNFVCGIREGLDYECGENGEALSIGQRQLVCLARASLRRSRVLVLDEATAAIDLETDELIQTTIRTAFQDCTVITIAHRINTILDYDRVIVMDAGNIVEFDSPDVLLADNTSIFYGMASSAGII